VNKRDRIGADNPLHRGGKSRDANGYVVLTSKEWGGNINRREHRVVMENILGRKIAPAEVVHHINGNRSDNRPENLTLESRASHNRKHGIGRLMTCASCGAERWYQPALAQRLSSTYKCRPCFRGGL
jgi:hypothetical protein